MKYTTIASFIATGVGILCDNIPLLVLGLVCFVIVYLSLEE